MRKFPSIDQFRHCVRAERDQAKYEDRAPAVRKYRGTVKLHGTNAGVVWKGGQSDLVFQSRNRVLGPNDDNAGFAGYFLDPGNAHWLKLAIATIAMSNEIPSGTDIAVFGEWCGEGIQKNVAISQLPKMFVIFAAYADGRWLDDIAFPAFEDARIYSVMQFPTWEVEIDFDVPQLVQNQMVEITEEVERCCPVGKHFGVEGIGEGVVWTPIDGDRDSKYWFKVKGEKHSVSKVAKLAAVDVALVQRKDDLVKGLCPDARLEQALHHHLNEANLSLEMRDIGPFLRCVFNDIAKEETDTIEANGFTVKELGKPISDIAKRFFIKASQERLAA